MSTFLRLALLAVTLMSASTAMAGRVSGYVYGTNRATTYGPMSDITNHERYARHAGHVLLGWCPKDKTAVWLSGTYGSCGVDDQLKVSAPKNPPKGNVTRFVFFNAADAQAGVTPPRRAWREKSNGKRKWRYTTLEGYEAWMKGGNTAVTVDAYIGIGDTNRTARGYRRVQ